MFFNTAEEVDEYICGMFRDAGDHPKIGPQIRAANIVLQVILTDPDCELAVAFGEDYQVIFGPTDLKPDITLLMGGDIADQFWCGDYNLATGIINGEAKTRVTVAGPTKTLINQLANWTSRPPGCYLARPPLSPSRAPRSRGHAPPCRG
jgi:hypothetical protein